MNIYKIQHYSVRPVEAETFVCAETYDSAIAEIIQVGRCCDEDIISISIVNDPKWPALINKDDLK